MFLCAYCKKPSRRREAPITLLLRARLRRYENGDHVTYGWEIVKQGPAAPSHKHHFRIDPTTKQIVPSVGFVLEPISTTS